MKKPKYFLTKILRLKLLETHKIVKSHGVPHWFPGLQSTVKIAMSCRKKPRKFFFSVFLAEFRLYFTGFLQVYVTVFLLKNYLTSKIKKRKHSTFFCSFMNSLILERKFSQPEMSLSQKYI